MNCDIPESKSMVNLSNRTSPEYMSINPSTLNPSGELKYTINTTIYTYGVMCCYNVIKQDSNSRASK